MCSGIKSGASLMTKTHRRLRYPSRVTRADPAHCGGSLKGPGKFRTYYVSVGKLL